MLLSILSLFSFPINSLQTDYTTGSLHIWYSSTHVQEIMRTVSKPVAIGFVHYTRDWENRTRKMRKDHLGQMCERGTKWRCLCFSCERSPENSASPGTKRTQMSGWVALFYVCQSYLDFYTRRSSGKKGVTLKGEGSDSKDSQQLKYLNRKGSMSLRKEILGLHLGLWSAVAT